MSGHRGRGRRIGRRPRSFGRTRLKEGNGPFDLALTDMHCSLQVLMLTASWPDGRTDSGRRW
jgi:hypothetical protein